MTQSSGRFLPSNLLVIPGEAIEQFIGRPDFIELICATHIDWNNALLLDAPQAVESLLSAVNGVVGSTRGLTDSGMRLLGRFQVDLENVAKHSALTDRFDIVSLIGKGSNSIALKAVNKSIGLPIVLEMMRPIVPRRAEKAIRKLGSLGGIHGLVGPIDSYAIEGVSVSGDPVRLYCIVFPFKDAITFNEYLKKRPPISPLFFEAFIRQVCGVLADLEGAGLQHGDLHGANILVSREAPLLEFTIIDPSPGLGVDSENHGAPSDLQWFREHLAKALLILQRNLPSISVQKHLGPRLYDLVNRIEQDEFISFREIVRLVAFSPRYERWLEAKSVFIKQKFDQPRPFGLLRWEELTDPAEAIDLFEPYPELFKRIRIFGNSLIVGARGSGKSTYLAALAYFPGGAKRLVPANEIFGILFSCRQGEFKQLSRDFLQFDAYGRRAVKHILVLKIIRRLLATLSSAVDRGEFDISGDLSGLYTFADSHMPSGCSIPRIGLTPSESLGNLCAGTVRWEEVEMDSLFRNTSPHEARASHELDEQSLLHFCEIVRGLFPQLAAVQFYILFDDAGAPNIPHETQHVLNDLVTSSNPIFCIKLSAERYSYELQDSAGRTLEETHDFTSFNIASSYASEGGFDQSRNEVKDYFSRIMKRRLEHWHYPSSDIAAYLGDQRRSRTSTISVSDLISRLASSRKDAYYSGWEVIWQLADKTPRNLIELVSEIFAHAKVQPALSMEEGNIKSVAVIRASTQDRAIRAVSDRRLRGLEFTPGEVTVEGRRLPLGKHLYLCASTFGKASHKYLTRSHGREGYPRLDERLAIERNDTGSLRRDAEEVLRLLVRYGIFDDSGLAVAFDDGQKKPIFVFNRLFCPAFSISFRRDAHLRLSAAKFEMYLLKPAVFLKKGTALLRGETSRRAIGVLWEGADDDDN